MGIEFALTLDGFAEKILKSSEDDLFKAGIEKASNQARKEIETNFEVGGRPTWPLTQEGRVPLNVTGRLKRACSEEAIVDEIIDGFVLYSAADQATIAEVQDKRYGIFTLPAEAEENVANSFEEGMLED